MKKVNIKTLLPIFLLLAFLLFCDIGIASSIKEAFTNPDPKPLDFSDTKNKFYTILLFLGWGAAICVTLFTGIQFLTAGAQKKAQLKEKLWLIVLGVALLAGGLPLLRLIVGIFQKAGTLIL